MSSKPILSRVRSMPLRDLYAAWLLARGESPLPALADVDPAGSGLERHSYLVAVTGPPDGPRFSWVAAGPALAERLGRPLLGDVAASVEEEEVVGSLAAAYRRCLRDRMPLYQHVRFDFGDGAPTRFERLLLPISADRQTITHLLGVVLFDDSPTEPGTEHERGTS